MRSTALKYPIETWDWEGENASRLKDQQVSLIRKELVALTGKHSHAVILNQLLYWTQRTKDFQLMLEEERVGSKKLKASPKYGWIYKTASELLEETILRIDRTTMRRYLNFLIAKEWIFERTNPRNKWDKTTQYRVNMKKIQKDLFALEQGLPDASKTAEISNGQNARSNVQNPRSKLHNTLSNVQTAHCNTETTSENTNREHTQDALVREVDQKNKDLEKFKSLEPIFSLLETMVTSWKIHVSQEGHSVHLTRERKHKLHSVLSLHFQNDLTQWTQFCERVAHSSFLMGQGSRKWRVSLDWVLREENLLKVLEGNFDNPEDFNQKQANQSKEDRAKETNILLASIEDPTWKKWCFQLDFESRDSVSLRELKAIVNARFLEVEDDRLVWVGSSDVHVLSRIEDLRLKILPIVQRTFPHIRNLRTRLLPNFIGDSTGKPASLDLIEAAAGKPVFLNQQQGGINHVE